MKNRNEENLAIDLLEVLEVKREYTRETMR